MNVALIGHGYWGPKLLRNYMEMSDVRVIWVCDARPEMLEPVSLRYPTVQLTSHLDDVLHDPQVEAVVIATPISTHFGVAEAALLADKHVFVEKPMASSSADCRKLVSLADDRGLTLMVGHTFVYSPPVRKVKEILDSGELGDVHYITSSRVNLGLHQRDVSVIWDLATHDLSILYYWLGESASSVSVLGRGCATPGVPDVAFVDLVFPSGVIASVHVSWLSPMKLRRTIIVGSKKMLLYDDTESVEKVKVFDHGVEMVESDSFGEFQLSYRTGDIIAPRIETSEPLYVEARNFVECCADGSSPISDGRAGLNVVAALEAAEHSMRNAGSSQSIPMDAEAGA